ncbi:FAD binding domain-containing protein [Apiospora saccharicola]
MQSIGTLTSPFRPQSCSFAIDKGTVTVGGGTQMGAVYEELAKINQTVVRGASKTVAVGGHLTGGGHSILAPRYGLGADQVLEMEVVSPMGDIVTANECQNQDLFWAMRGGGGSTFGVMTSVTMLIHPSPSMLRAYLWIASPEAGQGWFWDMLGYLLSRFPYLDHNGVSGYSTFLEYFHDTHDEGIISGLDQYAGSRLLDAAALAMLRKYPNTDSARRGPLLNCRRNMKQLV